MKVFFMGTPEFAAVSLNALITADIPVVGVFTQPDKPVGRKQLLESPPVKVLAEKFSIPVFQPKKLRDGTALNIIKSCKPDIIAVVAYGRILPKEILEYPEAGCINIHGSILPKYRGAAPIQWAVINGEHQTGVTAMYMCEELDAGDIIDTHVVDIFPDETAGELFERLAPIGGNLLCKTIRAIEDGTAARHPQDHTQATFAPQLKKSDSLLSWEDTGARIVSKISGLNPWPIATARIGDNLFKIFKAHSSLKDSPSPGTIICADSNGIEIACSDGSVIITELQAPGGKRMFAADYLRGHPLCL